VSYAHFSPNSFSILKHIPRKDETTMTLTTAQKTIVQSTFAQVTNPDLLAARFYARLFEIDPSTKPLFLGDIADQRKKLIQALVVVVNGINDLSAIVPAIQNLGRRHVVYGVTVDHWASVGSALLWTLELTFGEAFTPKVRDAWASAYQVIADTAITAAYPLLERQ